ncbi:glycosyltransferase [Thalassospira sp. TSL5-1]|uniref:glycosyltransferase n=1 Tax=Thalassospira sp. TSL5-1 TaxID=1544451 RepID=UPI00093ADE48|nr:glycosyltransferase [Thalassospira sp. TSL5-1]OKH89065.1 hypothetical protein LF95_03135 [Thalassospira sp. TSL5-1]
MTSPGNVSLSGDGITLVTTIHNGQAHWPGYFANLAEILGQDDHAVIIDDGSTPAVCLPQTLAHDARITLLSPGRIGRGAALNKAIAAAPSALIAIQDVDDQSLPARLPAMRDLLSRYPGHLVFCAALPASWVKGANGADNKEVLTLKATRLYRGNPLHHSALALNKRLWRDAGGYDETLSCCLDLDFYLRVLAQSAHQSLIFYERPLIVRHKGDDRHYQAILAQNYHRTALMVRNRYRTCLKPPLWMRAYDLRHYGRAWQAWRTQNRKTRQTRQQHKKHILAMVHLPPPLHGAAIMNQRAINVLAKHYRVSVHELRFSHDIAAIGRSSLAKYGRAVRYGVALFWRILTQRPDLVYASFAPSGPAFWRDSFYALMLRAIRLPIVFHLHGRGLKTLRDKSWLAGFVQKRVFKDQTAIILGPALMPEIDGLGCQPAVIANCADTPETPRDFAHTPSQSPLRILYLSNLIRSKGVETVIKAVGIARQSQPDLYLDIAGAEADLSAADVITLCKQAGLETNSTCHGPVGYDEKTRLFQTCDLFVFPSRYANEAQPLVVLEALAHALPVICSDAGTLSDVITDGQNGYILRNANDANELAGLILKLHNSPELRLKMAKAAHETFRAAFDANIFESRLTALFERLDKRAITNAKAR